VSPSGSRFFPPFRPLEKPGDKKIKISFVCNQRFADIASWFCHGPLYLLGMKKEHSETSERLISVLAVRRGKTVELRVHYEKSQSNGCTKYSLFNVEDVHTGTSTT
jgi:hypothetical protein